MKCKSPNLPLQDELLTWTSQLRTGQSSMCNSSLAHAPRLSPSSGKIGLYKQIPKFSVRDLRISDDTERSRRMFVSQPFSTTYLSGRRWIRGTAEILLDETSDYESATSSRHLFLSSDIGLFEVDAVRRRPPLFVSTLPGLRPADTWEDRVKTGVGAGSLSFVGNLNCQCEFSDSDYCFQILISNF